MGVQQTLACQLTQPHQAFWESEHAAVEREAKKKEQKALRNWRRLINAVLIAERIDKEYGTKKKSKSKSSAVKPEVQRLRATEQDGDGLDLGTEQAAGGFFLDGEEPADPAESERPQRINPLDGNYGTNPTKALSASAGVAERDTIIEGEETEDEDMEEVATETSTRTRKVISLATMIAAEDPAAQTQDVATSSTNRRGARRVAAAAPATTAPPPAKRARRSTAAPASAPLEPSPAAAASTRRSARRANVENTRNQIKASQQAERELDQMIDQLE